MILDSIKNRYFSLSHWQHIVIWLVTGLLMFASLFFVVGKVNDAWQLHKYNKARAEDIKKAQQAEQLEQQALGQAKVFQQQRDEALKNADADHEALLKALEVLNDSTKTAQQKRKAYEDIKNRIAPVIVTGGESVDELCKRATAVSPKIKCE